MSYAFDKAMKAYYWGKKFTHDTNNYSREKVEEVSSKKVIVSREVADALDHAFSSEGKGYLTKYRMIEACSYKLWGEMANVLNNVKPETMLDILMYGYEVELSPQEKLDRGAKKAHDAFAMTCNTSDEFYAYRTGMRDALSLLGYNFNWLNVSQDVESHTIKVDKVAKH